MTPDHGIPDRQLFSAAVVCICIALAALLCLIAAATQ